MRNKKIDGLAIVLIIAILLFSIVRLSNAITGGKQKEYLNHTYQSVYQGEFLGQEYNVMYNIDGLSLFVEDEEATFIEIENHCMYLDAISKYEIYVNEEKLEPFVSFEYEKGVASLYDLPLDQEVTAIDLRFNESDNVYYNSHSSFLSLSDWQELIEMGTKKNNQNIEESDEILYRYSLKGIFQKESHEFVFDEMKVNLCTQGYYVGTYQLNQEQLETWLSKLGE